MLIKALIAVRSGSKRVASKNTRKFADSNLLSIKIKQLQRIQLLDGIIVNSDDTEMLKIANDLGVETIKRDDIYASDTISMSDVYENMAINSNTDIIVYANVTNPLLSDDTITNVIKTYLNEKNMFDSINTAHLVKEFMFLDNKPINYDLLNQPRSQDLPNIYALNFALSVISRDKMIDCKNVVGRVPRMYEIDEYESIDIDNNIDFEIAEFLYRKRIANGC